MDRLPRLSLPRLLPVAALLLALWSSALPGHATAQTPSQDAAWQGEGDEYVVDITMPVPEGSYGTLYDSYYAARSGGRTHRANDLMAEKMTPAFAATGGVICRMDEREHATAGWYFTLCGDDGLAYVYVHMNDDTPGTDDGAGGIENAFAPGVREGVRVERGQHLGWVGDSGNAEHVSHLHFEIVEDTSADVRINPYPSLVAAEERGDFPGAPAPMPANPGDDDDPANPGDDDHDEDGDDEPAAPGPAVPGPAVPPETQDGGSTFTRLSGTTRLETAVALSRATRDNANSVVVVPSATHTEALVAAPLAGLLDAPVLLSGPDGLPEEVAAEIRRLRPRNAYLVGRDDQLSDQVVADLEDAGVVNHARMAADDPYALSAAVAEDLLTYDGVDMDGVILALGAADDASRAWPDALSASALAAETTTPILLTRGDGLPDAVAELLAAERPDRITVVGGTAAISEAVADQAAQAAGGTVERLAGATRYATSVAVAGAAEDAGLDGGVVWIATGRNFPDALAAGPAAAAAGSPLLLVDGLDPAGSPSSAEWLTSRGADITVIGGDAVVSDEVVAALTG